MGHEASRGIPVMKYNQVWWTFVEDSLHANLGPVDFLECVLGHPFCPPIDNELSERLLGLYITFKVKQQYQHEQELQWWWQQDQDEEWINAN